MQKISIAFLLTLLSCELYDNRLLISNNSNSDICVLTFYDSVPDLNNLNNTEYYLEDKIKNKESRREKVAGTNGWLHFFEASRNGKINIFIINADSLKIVGDIGSLLKDRRYKLLMFSKEDLDENSWHVIVK